MIWNNQGTQLGPRCSNSRRLYLPQGNPLTTRSKRREGSYCRLSQPSAWRILRETSHLVGAGLEKAHTWLPSHPDSRQRKAYTTLYHTLEWLLQLHAGQPSRRRQSNDGVQAREVRLGTVLVLDGLVVTDADIDTETCTYPKEKRREEKQAGLDA